MQIELFDTRPTDASAKGHHGYEWRIGSWSHRNFYGFLQMREDGRGPWQFVIYGFQGEPEEHGLATVYEIDDFGELRHTSVPIDPQNRITINGRKYGRANWRH